MSTFGRPGRAIPGAERVEGRRRWEEEEGDGMGDGEVGLGEPSRGVAVVEVAGGCLAESRPVQWSSWSRGLTLFERELQVASQGEIVVSGQGQPNRASRSGRAHG